MPKKRTFTPAFKAEVVMDASLEAGIHHTGSRVVVGWKKG